MDINPPPSLSRKEFTFVFCLQWFSVPPEPDVNVPPLSLQIYVHHGIHDLIFNLVGTLEAAQVSVPRPPTPPQTDFCFAGTGGGS